MADTEFGIKKLTAANWRERDPATKHFSRSRADGSFSDLAEEDWLQSVLTIELSERVPAEVRKLFAVARGTILYGYFFYPLLTLGSEQLYRVHEAALRHKWLQISSEGKKDESFNNMLAQFGSRGLLDATQLRQWTAVRQLRNLTSHPNGQSIYLPSWAFQTIEVAADLIEALFERP